jgi:Uma2 family endonuclease
VARASIVPLTIGQYQRMIDEKIVPEDSTVELLRGVLIRKDRSSPGEDPARHSPRHRLTISLLTLLAGRLLGLGRFMQIQLPVTCPTDGAPEPDASIIRGSPRDYAERLPTAGDVSSVIEAAHSSLDRDREDKLPIYAAAGVAQYIIVNLVNDTIEVYQDPDPEAQQYRTKVTLEGNQVLAIRLPDDGVFEVPVNELLP